MRNLAFIFFFTSLVCLSQPPVRINNSFIAFTIPEKDLLPESIAYDPQQQAFFVSSTRKGKVIKIDSNGNVSDFITPKQDGLWMTIGMKVDAQRRVLWVCSSGGDNLVDYNLKDETDGRPAGIFKFDLNSGALIDKYVFSEKGQVHFINDLTINKKNGDIYFTHMFDKHAIYKLAWNQEPELFITTKALPYPNGIAIKEDKKLFVAHSNGISSIDIQSKKITQLSIPEGQNISKRASIDGLYYYKWSLIGVHPDISTVSQMDLNDNGDGIKQMQTLEKNHPLMMNPTTGVLVQNQFYYLANAQFGSFNEDGTLWPMEQLFEPIILKVTID
ncbi:SMP-30/gluconolactonase/LRE family protein [Ekhidna sp. To15]|uniref:SMP-30/gluconolactonase/LRE family protein n=1 Tax=Ekhidna sp. To15 TaxID=3395267 RepID=UPI003F521F61